MVASFAEAHHDAGVGNVDGEVVALAESGDALAQTRLGFAHALGLDVASDDAEAVRWWSRAADQGNAFAQTMLGWAYMDARGVCLDRVQAYARFSLIAQDAVRTALGPDGTLAIERGAALCRDIVAGLMTSEQIDRGQRVAAKLQR